MIEPKEKSEYQLEIEAKTEHLLGTTWYGVDYKEFKLITLGPLKRWESETDDQDFTCLTDDTGNIRWWPHFVDRKVNKGEVTFKEKSDAVSYLAELHRREISKYQEYLDFHTGALDELSKL